MKKLEMPYFHLAVMLLILMCLISFNVIIAISFYLFFGDSPSVWVAIMNIIFPSALFCLISAELFVKKKRKNPKEKEKINFI